MQETYRWWFFVLFAATVLAEMALEGLNRRHLEKHAREIPLGFEGVLDATALEKSRAYTLAKMRFSMLVAGINAAGILIFLFGGLWKVYHAWIFSWQAGFIARGLAYFLGLMLLGNLASIPFSLYRNFRLEKRFGFNTLTPRLWISDWVKSLAVSGVVAGFLGAAGLWLVERFPASWWLWVWLFFLGFNLFFMYLSPYLIEPLFNRFKPLDKPEWLDAIRVLMSKAGIRVGRIFESDASKRSRHTNAYFTGLGTVKRIVLFDTLLQKIAPPELLAVLAHEAGHWKKKHLLKRLGVSAATAFMALYISHRLLQTHAISEIFGMVPPSFYADVIGLAFAGSVLGFLTQPISCYFSRRQEWEADAYSVGLTGDASSLASALIGLSRDNLTNLHPHPWYAAFYYSHPPLAERVRKLQYLAGQR